MNPAKRIKDKFQHGDTVVGMIIMNHLWPQAVELAVDAELDYLIVCMEHGAYNVELVAQVCSLGRVMDFAVFIRPPTHDFATISKTMDLGPCGLLLPCVDRPQNLDIVRDAIHMPPRGRRRPGGSGTRWVSSYNYESWKQQVEDHLIIVPQIESPEGVTNVRAIASHEIVTAIGVGPYDLSMAVVGDYDPTHPKMIEAMKEICRAGEAAGKIMWRIGSDLDALFQQGFRFLCLGDPMDLLKDAVRKHTDPLRG